MKHYFITGTDTEIGKTFVTRTLLAKAQQQSFSAVAIKPVAAGGINTPEGFKNDDAYHYQQANSFALDYAVVNPFLTQSPLSPHIAAAQDNITLDARHIAQTARFNAQADYVFYEGAGGWLCPINAQETLADVAVQLQAPVILVVGLRLGCLNHSLLTVANIQAKKLPLAGWVANCIDPTMLALTENINTLTKKIPAPLLGILPYSINKDIQDALPAIQLPAS